MKVKAQKENLKIAMFGQKRIPSREGGVEIVVEELAVRMARKGHDVVCYNRKGHHVSGVEFDNDFSRDEYKGVKLKSVFTVDKRGLAAATSSAAAALKASLSGVDVVHIHAEGPAFMSWLPKLFGKRVIVTVHGLDWNRSKWGGFASWYLKKGEEMAVKHAHEIIVLSRGVQNYFKEKYNRDTVFIPNGVKMPDIKDAQLITEKYRLNKDNYILYLGRIVPEKGISYLIEAFKNVKTDKKLVIAGGASDTDEFMSELKDMAKEDERIVFTGFVQGQMLEELYSNAYIYTLPSDLEGMPLSLLEAMSYGNCCLTSDIAECAEVVTDKAVTFKKGDVGDLTEKLQTLCDCPDVVQDYKSHSAAYICQRYNWDDIVEQTLKLYI